MRVPTKITASAAALLAAISATTGTAVAEVSPLEELNASTESAIVYLETTWSGRVFDTAKSQGEQFGYVRSKPFTVTSRCTGFVVNPDGHIVTAGHCVEYSDKVEAALIQQAAKWTYAQDYWVKGASFEGVLSTALNDFRVDGERQGRPDRAVQSALGISLSGESSGSVQPARVLAVRGFDSGDVALLKVVAENLPSLQLATDTEIGVGTEVVSIGYPASVDLVTDETYDPSYKDGTISSEKTREGLLEVFEISAPVSGGMSGGPTVDQDGKVVGLNSFGILGETQPFNFIRPVDIIEEMLLDKGVTNEVGPVQESFLTGLDAYFAGDKEGAIAQFDQVLAQVASHKLAQQYRAEAALLPDAAPVEEGGLPILPLGIAALLIIVGGVAGGAVLVVRNTRKNAPTAVAPAVIELPEPERVQPYVAPTADTLEQNGHRSCTGCGAKQELGNRFCPECGQPAEQSLVQ